MKLRSMLYEVPDERLRSDSKDREAIIYLEQGKYGSVFYVPLHGDLVAARVTDQMTMTRIPVAKYCLRVPIHTIRADGQLWDAYEYRGDGEC